jgi:hypothetical protein
VRPGKGQSTGYAASHPVALSHSSRAVFEQCRFRFKVQYIDRLGDRYRKARPYFTMANHVHDTLRDFMTRIPEEQRGIHAIEGLLRERSGGATASASAAEKTRGDGR